MGWPAPSVMHRSMSSGLIPDSSCSATALNRYGKSRRLTTKPGRSGTSTGVLSNASQSARALARVASVASSGKASSTSSIFGTGWKTCSPTKRSDAPEARASRSIDNDDVVLASSASWSATRPRSARTTALTTSSSLTASITIVASPSASMSVSTRTCCGSTSPLSLPQMASTLPRARCAELSERAQSTTSPWLCRAAATARPQAIAPLPAMPSSFLHAPLTHWLTGQSMIGNLHRKAGYVAQLKGCPHDEWSTGS